MPKITINVWSMFYRIVLYVYVENHIQRGVPGSGKSYLLSHRPGSVFGQAWIAARNSDGDGHAISICSADNYFVDAEVS